MEQPEYSFSKRGCLPAVRQVVVHCVMRSSNPLLCLILFPGFKHETKTNSDNRYYQIGYPDIFDIVDETHLHRSGIEHMKSITALVRRQTAKDAKER